MIGPYYNNSLVFGLCPINEKLGGNNTAKNTGNAVLARNPSYSSISIPATLTNMASGYGYAPSEDPAAYKFDGSNDCILLGTAMRNAMANYAEFTISVWGKLNATNSPGTVLYWVYNGNIQANIYLDGSGTGYIILNRTTGQTSQSTFSYDTSKVTSLFNLVICYNGAGSTNADKVRAYFNNSPLTLSISGTPPVSLSSLDGINAYISHSSSYPWAGVINNYMWFNKSLTDFQLTDLYNMGANLDDWSLSNAGVLTVPVKIKYESRVSLPLLETAYVIGNSFGSSGSLTIGGVEQNISDWCVADDSTLIFSVNKNTPKGLQNVVVTNNDNNSNSTQFQLFIQDSNEHWKSVYPKTYLPSKFTDGDIHLYVNTDNHISTNTQTVTGYFNTFALRCKEDRPDAIILCGDIGDNLLDYVKRAHLILRDLPRPYYYAIGNHDELTGDEGGTNANNLAEANGWGFGPPFWATAQLSSGDETLKARLIVLDWNFYDDDRSLVLEEGDRVGFNTSDPIGGYARKLGEVQLAWVESVLAADTDSDIIIYMSHEATTDIKDLHDIFEADGRKVIGLMGHGHNIARKRLEASNNPAYTVPVFNFLAAYDTGAWTDFVVGYENGEIVIRKAEINNLLYPANLITQTEPFTVKE